VEGVKTRVSLDGPGTSERLAARLSCSVSQTRPTMFEFRTSTHTDRAVHPSGRIRASTVLPDATIASAGDEAHYSGASHEVATRARSPVRSHPLIVLKMASLSIG
jgi:hypothetical protein